MTLKQQMESDALSVFLRTDDFAETVTYYAGGSGGGRVINAIIDRDIQLITDEGVPALATFITVANDSTSGISSTEIDTGLDTVGVALRYGESEQVRQIAGEPQTDEGMVRFQVN